LGHSVPFRGLVTILHLPGSLPRLPNRRLAAVIFIEMAASIPRLGALLGAPLSRKETDEIIVAAVEILLHGCGTD